MDTTSIIGQGGTPVIVTGGNGHGNGGYGYDNGRRDCVEELIVQNTVHTGATANLDATHRNTANVLNAVADAARDNSEASNRNGIAGIKETSDVGRDNIRETSRAGSDNLRETARVGADLSHAMSESRAAIERTNGEGRLSMAIASGEIRELIATTASAGAIAAKDIQIAVFKDGCDTRTLASTQHADLQKEMLKGFADNKYEALKNKCDMEKLIAECCCEQKLLTIQQGQETRSLILAEGTKRCEAENADLRMQVLLSKNGGGK